MKSHFFLKCILIALKDKKKIFFQSIIIWVLFSSSIWSVADFGCGGFGGKEGVSSLKTNNSGIFINSPENTTLSGPISEYYPGTYGFESDLNDYAPSGWGVDKTVGGCLVKVNDRVNNHKKVLVLDDISISGYSFAENIWSTSQPYGTIEFWFMTSNVNKLTQIILSYGETSRFRLRIKDGEWCVGSSYSPLPGIPDEIKPEANTWYHLRIDFETTTGDYNDLGQYRCRIIINDEYVSGQINWDTQGQLDRIWFITSGEEEGYSIYFDSIGYSFDPEYSIGDNLNEGLLISFDTAYDFESISYSMDKMPNKAIKGNHTLPMPLNGLHSVQVFGIYQSVTYTSELRYFSIYEPFDILTPKNITYSSPMDGYYVSTYGFNNEPVGEAGENIEFVDYYTDEFGVELYVAGLIDGHKNVLDLYDHSAVNRIDFSHQFETPQTYGTVEWWWGLSDASRRVGIGLRSGTSFGPRLDINGGYLRYFDPSSNSYKNTNVTIISEKWYHMQLDFECGSGGYTGLSEYKYRLKIDGSDVNPLILSFDDNVASLNNLRIWSDQSLYRYHAYFDAFGFSWEDYNIGDNKFEGFLLDYKLNFNTNWITCSLDGTPNQTIGETYLLPLAGVKANEGHHNVQIFAEDSQGTIHQTDLRYFSYYQGAKIPACPTNFKATDGIKHIYLTWSAPSEINAPILKYNIYRGNQTDKSFLDSTIDTFYNDTDSGNYIGKKFYYYVTTVNIIGESIPSEEDYAIAHDAPFVIWINPLDGQRILFPYNKTDDFNEWVQFHFEFDFAELDTIELYIDNHNYGNVSGKDHIILLAEHVNKIDPVSATLCGYQNTIWLYNDTVNLTFVNINFEVTETLNESTQVLGKQLYLILHDPNGDNSYSGFSQTTKLSIAVGCELTASIGVGLTIGSEFELFGVGAGASMMLEAKTTTELGYDFRYEVSDTTSLTSSQITDNPDYIGPGYGDRYWGEAWIFRWIVNATQRFYSNGTCRWEDPQIFYGIIRDVETFLSDANAPAEWRAQNAVHNNSIPVDWSMAPIEFFPGSPYLFEHEVTTTETRKASIKIDLGSEFRFKLETIESVLSLSLSIKNYAEQELSNVYKVNFQIDDDDVDDSFLIGRGYDLRFGTLIFGTYPMFCRTSHPYEHNTYDYLPPEIDYPTIDLDSDGDGDAPTNEDSPLITVGLYEEGAIQEFIVNYSINGGTNWNILHLQEQEFNPGIWETSIPAQSSGTTVMWYLMAWDTQGNKAVRKDTYGNVFQYTVLEGATTPNNGVPSYSTFLIFLITIGAIIALTLVHKKRYKIYDFSRS